MTTFIKLISEPEKAATLLLTIEQYRSGRSHKLIFEKALDQIAAIPSSPFAYWVGDKVLESFRLSAFDSEQNGRTTRCGISTLDNFRFLRVFWEIRHDDSGWNTYFNGGIFSRFYDEFSLKIRWFGDGKEVRAFVASKVGSASRKVQGTDKYFSAGFIFPRRTKGFCPKFMPSGGIFSTGGQAGFARIEDLPATIGLLSSYACTFLISLSQGRTGDSAQYEVGQVKRMPWPGFGSHKEELSRLAIRAWSLRRLSMSTNETSMAFILPKPLLGRLVHFDQPGIENELARIQTRIDAIAFDLYGFQESESISLNEMVNFASHERDSSVEEEELELEDEANSTSSDQNAELLSWCVGVIFGRFDWRFAIGERSAPPEPGPFEPLPTRSPGMLSNGADEFHPHLGILLDEPGHSHDLCQLIEDVLACVGAHPQLDVRRWMRREFFPFHLPNYSKSSRKAPIYWPLSTASGGYTLWLYYPALSGQTLYITVNEFVEPKLEQLGKELAALANKGSARSRDDDRAMEVLQTLDKELVEVRDILLQIAPSYRPNHDDGVQITAAPLWPLFRHKPWQKLLKETWEKLNKGDYDWSHLAMAYWPDRVREKCKTDKSLAIAHGLEEHYEPPQESATGAGRGGRKRRGAAP